MAMYYANAPITTRTMTPEGFLKAGATLTRTGIHRYQREELDGVSGLPDNTPVITVNFTPESVFHPDTIASLRGVPLTIGHPANNTVSPQSWQVHTRGSVIGDPVPDRNTGLLNGEVFIGDAEAIQAVDSGVKQLSIGYGMQIVRTPEGVAHFDTVGPINMNHLALVDNGRSGETVRILNQGGDTPMTDSEITSLASKIAGGITQQLQAANAQAPAGGTVDVGKIVGEHLAAGLKPLVEQVEAITAQNATAKTEAEKVEARNKAKAAAENLKKEVLENERKRYAVLNEARAVLGPEQVANLQNASTKEILVAACLNSVPNAAELSEDTLRGYLMAMAASRGQAQPGAGALGAGTGMVPGYLGGYAPPQVNGAPGFVPVAAPNAAPPQQVAGANSVDAAFSQMVHDLENSHLLGNEPEGGAS